MKSVLHLLADGNVGGTEILCSNYLSLSKNKNTVVFLWGQGTIADEMITKGFDVSFMKCSHFNLSAMVKSVLKICDEHQIDVIISHHSIAAIHLCLLRIKKIRPSIKVVFYAQSNAEDICKSNHKFLKPILKKIIRKFYFKADAVIAISNSVKNSLIDILGENNIAVIYNGVQIKTESNLYKIPKKNDDKHTLIYVGRLIEEKGVQNILMALSKVNAKYTLKIVGDGGYRQNLEDLCAELDINKDVEFLGFRRDIYSLLSQSDFFVHFPVCEEGFGLTIVEAMSAGLVCICGNRGAVTEIIQDGVNGYVVNNIDELSSRIEICLTNAYGGADLRMRENARKNAEDFSIEKYSEIMDDFIVQLSKG